MPLAPSSFSENLQVLVRTPCLDLDSARVWFGFGSQVFLLFVIYNVNSDRLVVSGIRRS
jgi:hypothetical protein